MSETFYRKYRPQMFADIVGQKHVVKTLTQALSLGRVGHSYLFTGPRGTGKTTLARIFAKAVNCLDRKKNNAEPCGKCEHCVLMAEGRSMDVIEIDAASHTGVDNIRELRETVTLPPTLGSHKIYIIDEVHMLSIGAFNALLKTLEEPPAHVIFILATTALHKVPDTIVSRCQRFDLGRFPISSIVEKLSDIAKAEKIKADKEALEMIALSAEGGMRDAESLFMQVTTLSEGPITPETVTEVLGATQKECIFELLGLIAEGQTYQSLSFVRTLSQDGRDLTVFSGGLLHTLRDLLFLSVEGDPSELPNYTGEYLKKLSALVEKFTPDDIVRMLEYIQVAARETKNAFIEELPLEIALVKILSKRSNTGSDGSSRMDRGKDEEVKKKASEKGSPSGEESAKQSLTQDVSSVTNHVAMSNGAIELEKVREFWPQILSEVKRQNASISVALSQARLLETRGDVVVLQVKYSFHKERLAQKNYQLTLLEAFENILDTQVRLEIVLESPDKPKEADEATDNQLLNQALEMLGGRIVTES